MKRLSIFIFSTLCTLFLHAQTFDALPYSYGFETYESAEQANWVLNPGTDMSMDSIDRWTVGSAIAYEGNQAMYISIDNGATATAGTSTSRQIVQFAYRDFILPTGQYYMTFDWLCPTMSIYAGYIPYVNLDNSEQSQNVREQFGKSILPNVGTPSVGALHSDKWNNSLFSINVKQPTNGQIRTIRIWFAWVNDQDSVVQDGISAVIDNLQLVDAKCAIPYGFKGEVLDCDHVNFEWLGASAQYQFQFRPTGDTGLWRNRMLNNGETFISVQSMDEGKYDFRLRGICFSEDTVTGLPDTTYSPYIYLTNFTIFFPESHCINFLNLNDTNWVKCTYGKSGQPWKGTSVNAPYEASVNAPYQNTGVIDYGWDNILSRHTIIIDTTATDPRTNDMLRMVPRGKTASVRLGNWDVNNGAEAITYKYNVDSANNILLINYAIVMDWGADHKIGFYDVDSRFVINIKDELGEIIDSTCAIVNLTPNTKSSIGWNRIGYFDPGGRYMDSIVFKDWTTLGVNLDQYVGQTIYISVETFDCFLGKHYGYAYFTMDCLSSRMYTNLCGEQNNITANAPSGFKYEWYAGNDTTLRSTQQSIQICSNDSTNWHCRLTSFDTPSCSFEIELDASQSYPQAEFFMEYEPKNCENIYKITNTSYIWTNENGTRYDHKDRGCDKYEWYFGKPGQEDVITDPNPGYILYPEEGGQFTVVLKAIIDKGGGLCESIDTLVLSVPAIGDTHTIIDTTINEGSFFEFHEIRYAETGVYTYVGKTQEGCVADDTLYLHVIERPEVLENTSNGVSLMPVFVIIDHQLFIRKGDELYDLFGNKQVQ